MEDSLYIFDVFFSFCYGDNEYYGKMLVFHLCFLATLEKENILLICYIKSFITIFSALPLLCIIKVKKKIKTIYIHVLN